MAHDADVAPDGTAPTPVVMAVDLDGTLLRSDMLFESFWAALAQDWRKPVSGVMALSRGRAALKASLADAPVDVRALPYDETVIARVRAWRAKGGRSALVTATNQHLAQRIADHLDLFDEVHGSSDTRNLKGPEKARFLTDRFGKSGYVYVGDDAADLPVWANAARAISVGATPAVRRALDAGPVPVEHIERPSPSPKLLLEALRPHQWLKNLLVFVPLLTNQDFSAAAIIASCLAFVAISIVASAGYLLNDLLDLSDDRSHPRKRNRPFASGRLPVATGSVMLPVLLTIGMMIALLVSPLLAGVIAIYFVSTTAYSVKLKRHTLIDICMLAFLYTVRIIAGGMAIGAALSVWLLAFSMFIFFALAAVKRQAELADHDGAASRTNSRRGYRPEDSPVVTQMAVSAGFVAVLVLALYLNEPVVQENYSSAWLLWGACPLLLFWISRMVLIAGRGEMHDDPLVFALENRTSRWTLTMMLALFAGAALI